MKHLIELYLCNKVYEYKLKYFIDWSNKVSFLVQIFIVVLEKVKIIHHHPL